MTECLLIAFIALDLVPSRVDRYRSRENQPDYGSTVGCRQEDVSTRGDSRLSSGFAFVLYAGASDRAADKESGQHGSRFVAQDREHLAIDQRAARTYQSRGRTPGVLAMDQE